MGAAWARILSRVSSPLLICLSPQENSSSKKRTSAGRVAMEGFGSGLQPSGSLVSVDLGLRPRLVYRRAFGPQKQTSIFPTPSKRLSTPTAILPSHLALTKPSFSASFGPLIESDA